MWALFEYQLYSNITMQYVKYGKRLKQLLNIEIVLDAANENSKLKINFDGCFIVRVKVLWF